MSDEQIGRVWRVQVAILDRFAGILLSDVIAWRKAWPRFNLMPKLIRGDLHYSVLDFETKIYHEGLPSTSSCVDCHHEAPSQLSIPCSIVGNACPCPLWMGDAVNGWFMLRLIYSVASGCRGKSGAVYSPS